MANLGGTFDANTVEPNTGPPPALPTGWYPVMITDSEIKKTKAGDGGMVVLTLKVMEGPYAGRLAWDRLNLWNPNKVAEEIAQKTLSAICHATGVFKINDTQELHGKPMMARIVYKEADGKYDEGNDVKGYAKIGDKEMTHTTKVESGNSGAATSAPAGAAPDFSPPWAGQQAQNPNPPAPPAQPAPATPSSPPAQPTTPPAPEQPATPPPAQPPAETPAPPANPPAEQPAQGGNNTTPPWLQNNG